MKCMWGCRGRIKAHWRPQESEAATLRIIHVRLGAISGLKSEIALLDIRRPEICRAVLAIALAKTVLQQSSPTPLVPVQGFNADQRQVPMRLGWPVMLGSLKDPADFGLLLARNAFCHHRLKRALVAVNARRKPKRDAEAVGGALRCSRFK